MAVQRRRRRDPMWGKQTYGRGKAGRSRSGAYLDEYGTPRRRVIETPNAAAHRARRAEQQAANPPHRRKRPARVDA